MPVVAGRLSESPRTRRAIGRGATAVASDSLPVSKHELIERLERMEKVGGRSASGEAVETSS
jgi:hypothetical protein